MIAKRNAFTILETLMVVLVIGIIAVITIPKFMSLRMEANNARIEGCQATMRSATAIYYGKTALPEYEYLCTTDKTSAVTPRNEYRDAKLSSGPCYPANCPELQNLLISMDCDVQCLCIDDLGNEYAC